MSNYKFETLQLHVGQEQADPATDSRAVPIYQTTSYVFHNSKHAAARFGLADPGNIYGRLTNSTQEVLEKRLAALEGGTAALAVASGAAAISYTIQALAAGGGHIVAQKTIYGGSFNLLGHTLPQYGIRTTFVNAHDLAEVEGAIQDDTRAVYLETLGNPNSDIPDIDAISELAHRYGLPVVVDNTFGTPYLIRPIEHGADIVVHSATKFIGGHGTTLGGIIVESGKFDWKAGGKYPQLARRSRSVLTDTPRTPRRLLSSLTLIRLSRRSTIPLSPTIPTTLSMKNTSRTAELQSSHSRLRAARKRLGSSSIIFRFSRCSQTSPT